MLLIVKSRSNLAVVPIPKHASESQPPKRVLDCLDRRIPDGKCRATLRHTRLVGAVWGIATVSILAVSLYAFARGDLMERRAHSRRLVVGAGIVVATLVIGTAGLLFAETRLDPSFAQLSRPRLTPSGEGVIVTADRENGKAQQVWLVRFDGDLVLFDPLAERVVRGEQLPIASTLALRPAIR